MVLDEPTTSAFPVRLENLATGEWVDLDTKTSKPTDPQFEVTSTVDGKPVDISKRSIVAFAEGVGVAAVRRFSEAGPISRASPHSAPRDGAKCQPFI